MTPPEPGTWLGSEGIEARLRQALQPSALNVRDDSHLHAGHSGAREGGHFHVTVRSERFSGLSRVARHRLVYDCLAPSRPDGSANSSPRESLLNQGIHALSVDARTPSEP